ncbi:hypothetical protein [Streptomyces sp. NPDC052701]|uniref:hypothetical protein n=1 Tax=Streptomyces sp. NPDC052701 TaxID=3155533 RepID=UPI0034409512
MTASRRAGPDRTPGRTAVECGPYSRTGHGCTGEREDAAAARPHTLARYVTRDERHARRAVDPGDA